MSDYLTGLPPYAPDGDVARAVARTLIEHIIHERMTRGNLTVSLGAMRDDGAVPLTVTARAEEFDFRSLLDDPTIHGTAWIEDRPSAPLHIWYSFPAQEHTVAESNYADTPPVNFWMRYGRD